MVGIYKFTNRKNGMSYIGQSTNIKRRYNNYIMNINNKQQHIYFELLVKLTERRGGTYENIRRWHVWLQQDKFI